MKERFSAPQIASRKPESLARFLRKYSVHHPDEKAAKFITLARNALPPEADRVFALQQSLAASAELYLCLDRNAKCSDIGDMFGHWGLFGHWGQVIYF